MKKHTLIILLASLLTLSSCSFLDKIKSLFGKKSDPEMGLTDADNEWREPDPKNFTYTECEGGIKLTSYNFSEDLLTISVPEKINGKKVVAIAKDCFKLKRRLSRPIEESPDYNPDSPTYYIGKNVIKIEDSSFNLGATFFTEYEDIPEDWEDGAILRYSAIDDKGNTYFSVTPKEIFVYKGVVYYEHRTLNAYFVAKCLTKSKDISIVPLIKGKKVVTIGFGAFKENKSIETLTLPSTIVEFHESSFTGCTNLQVINAEESEITLIKKEVFRNCLSLKEIRLPKNLATIQYMAFADCGTIEKVYIPKSVLKMNKSTFVNTIVLEIFYGGSLEMWQNLTGGASYTGLEDTIMHYSENAKSYVLDKPSKEFESIESGSFVTVTGVITGYDHLYNSLYITDPSTCYTIKCYDATNKFEELVSELGRKIKVSGIRSSYLNNPELVKPTYSFVGEEKFDIEPKYLDWSKNRFEDYAGFYILVDGYIESYNATQIILEEYPNVPIKGFNMLPEEKEGSYITAHVFVALYGEFAQLDLYDIPIEFN